MKISQNMYLNSENIWWEVIGWVQINISHKNTISIYNTYENNSGLVIEFEVYLKES